MKKKILSGVNEDKVAIEYSEFENVSDFHRMKKALADFDFVIQIAGIDNFYLLATALRENPNLISNLPKIMSSLKGMGFG